VAVRMKKAQTPKASPGANGQPTLAATNSSDRMFAEKSERRDVSVVIGEVVSGVQTVGRRLRQPSPEEGRLRTRLALIGRELEAMCVEREAAHNYDGEVDGVPGSEPFLMTAAALLTDARDALEAKEMVSCGELLRAAERAMLTGRDAETLGVELRACNTQLSLLVPDLVGSGRVGEGPKAPAADAVKRQRRLLDSVLGEFDRQVSERARGLTHLAVVLWATVVMAGAATRW
jgi:hypothetical protein